MDENKIQLFEDQKIRTAWDEEKEEWYFSVVDVVGILTEQPDYDGARNYWKVMKKRLSDEGSELVTNCNQLKMKSPKDGKNYKTDVADTEQLLRIIQSIPSPKAEPFKLWLAQVGRERIEETINPEMAIDRALETYQKKEYSNEWIHQRILSIRIRNALTDEWQKNGVQEGCEYAILTDEITKAWSGMSTRQYKNLKGLKKENLRVIICRIWNSFLICLPKPQQPNFPRRTIQKDLPKTKKSLAVAIRLPAKQKNLSKPKLENPSLQINTPQNSMPLLPI